MDDLILFEIYGNYIGFADFEVPTFTKTSIFFKRMLVSPRNLTEKRQIGYSKKWKSFRDLATSVFLVIQNQIIGGPLSPPCEVGLKQRVVC